CRPSCKETRRAGLPYDFSPEETHYDRNSYPRFISDGMSELNVSVKKACKQPVFQTRDRHRGRIERPSARWLTLRQTLRARPTAASMRPVELGISERPHYRDIAAITAKGAPIYGVDINVLQFVVIG